MPFTPYHMGPGLAVKAVAGSRFSLMVYGFTQVAMDLEPLVRMYRRDVVLHGFTHTLLGATLVGLGSVLVGRPVCQRLLNLWTPDPGSPFLSWLRGPEVLSWTAAISGAVVGAYGHVLLDSILYVDTRPFALLSQASPLFNVISNEWVYRLCVASGLAGAIVLPVVFLLRRRAPVERDS